MNKELVIVRGGGDIASGTIMKLYKCGYSVLILEIPHPSSIRRNVSFSEAVYEKAQTVEDVTCYLAEDIDEAKEFLNQGKLTALVDPDCKCLNELKPIALIDAILAKNKSKNAFLLTWVRIFALASAVVLIVPFLKVISPHSFRSWKP